MRAICGLTGDCTETCAVSIHMNRVRTHNINGRRIASTVGRNPDTGLPLVIGTAYNDRPVCIVKLHQHIACIGCCQNTGAALYVICAPGIHRNAPAGINSHIAARAVVGNRVDTGHR
ncbi:MAG: hypothetical protein MESAZ_02079 [Saezia sanguinis]